MISTKSIPAQWVTVSGGLLYPYSSRIWLPLVYGHLPFTNCDGVQVSGRSPNWLIMAPKYPYDTYVVLRKKDHFSYAGVAI